MIQLLEHPNSFMWVALVAVVLVVVVGIFRDAFGPLVGAIVEGLSAMAVRNPLLFVLALCLGLSATADAVADVFFQIDRTQWEALGWWQVMALWFKAFKPIFATIAALLINPPRFGGGAPISSGVSTAPFDKKDPPSSP